MGNFLTILLKNVRSKIVNKSMNSTKRMLKTLVQLVLKQNTAIFNQKFVKIKVEIKIKI